MRVENGVVLDDSGRTLILRGCNLGGDSKYPMRPDGSSRSATALADPATASFIGRPFQLEEADAHFSRLASWGFNALRYLLTWEAIEHAGPGVYDESYLAYVRKILKKAEEYGFSIILDPHQDVWSRWTGGDGAPAWTLEKLGMDLSRLASTGAALRYQDAGDYPTMCWPTNYNRYAAATLFTLFFAGNRFAPETLIDGERAQDWLQARYLAAMRHAYRRLKDCRAIVGWGSMNEPHPGYIGYRDLRGLERCSYAVGLIPTAFQSMTMASGFPETVSYYTTGVFGRRTVRSVRVDPAGRSLFNDGYVCPWKRAGVWTDEGGHPRLIRKDYFASVDGRPVSFAEDFLKPFLKRFAEEIRAVRPDAMLFIEGVPFGERLSWSPSDGAGVVNAFHWYDGFSLVTKRYTPHFSIRSDTRRPVFGRRAVIRSYGEQLAEHLVWARERMGSPPSLLGEFGLPFDLNRGAAYRNGDFRPHERAFSAFFDAIDEHLLHALIWNYCARNTEKDGDGWNGEDLSIWTSGKGDQGARALEGWRRPFARATAGEPISMRWDRRTRTFRYRFRADPRIAAPTELFVPSACFGGTPIVLVEPANACAAEFSADTGIARLDTGSFAGEVAVTVRPLRSARFPG